MHDETAYKDRLDVTNLEEGISALIDSRTRPVPQPSLRRPIAIRDQSEDGPASGDTPALASPAAPAGPGEAGPDYVNHPPHYTAHPSGVECITITRWMNFNRGNAVKYIWRAGDKGNEIEDLKKAAWYIADEIARLERLRDGG